MIVGGTRSVDRPEEETRQTCVPRTRACRDRPCGAPATMPPSAFSTSRLGRDPGPRLQLDARLARAFTARRWTRARRVRASTRIPPRRHRVSCALAASGIVVACPGGILVPRILWLAVTKHLRAPAVCATSKSQHTGPPIARSVNPAWPARGSARRTGS